MPEWAWISQRDQRKRQKHVMLTWEFPWKSYFTTFTTYQGTFPFSNAKILKVFPKTFPPKWSLLNAQQKKKNEARKGKEEGRSLQGKGNTFIFSVSMGRAVFSFPESHFLFTRQVWGSGGRREWGRVALHDGQGLLWCKTLSIGTALEIDPYLLPCSQVLYWLSWKYNYMYSIF